MLHFSGGNLLDKEYEVLLLQDDQESVVSSLFKQYYISRGVAPKVILLPFVLDDMEVLSELLEQKYGHAVRIKVPQRGDNARLIDLAHKNAMEEAERVTTKEEKHQAVLLLLGKMLNIDLPKRIESFDISNISGTDTVGSMVVFEGGNPKKREYKHFRIEDMANQDDYAAMAQVVTRRFRRYLEGDSSFSCLPDLLLIDGGAIHAKIAHKQLVFIRTKHALMRMCRFLPRRIRTGTMMLKELYALCQYAVTHGKNAHTSAQIIRCIQESFIGAQRQMAGCPSAGVLL